MKYCKCGCKTEIDSLRHDGKPKSYAPGHGNHSKIKNWIPPKKKFCNGCKKILSISEFYTKTYKSKYSGEKYKRYRTRCINCEKQALKSKMKERNKTRKIKRRNARKNNNIVLYLQDKIYHYKLRADKIGVPFNLTKEYLLELYNNQSGLCYFTGIPLTMNSKIGVNSNISLDRLYPNKGYVMGNVVWCSYFVNTMKGKLNIKEFYKILKNILFRANNKKLFNKTIYTK